MKADLATSVIAAIAGIIIAYFATNILIPELEDVSFNTISESVNASLVEPNIETFNYRAVNPTVEVYVGQCTEYNEDGMCIDDGYQSLENEGYDEEETPDEEENGDTN